MARCRATLNQSKATLEGCTHTLKGLHETEKKFEDFQRAWDDLLIDSVQRIAQDMGVIEGLQPGLTGKNSYSRSISRKLRTKNANKNLHIFHNFLLF